MTPSLMSNWTKSKFGAFLVIGVLLTVLISSCSKKVITRKYYMVDFPYVEDTSHVSQTPLGKGFCEIVPTRVSPPFAKSRIALRAKSHELSYFAYHQWAVAPGEAITNILENYIQSRHIFGYVTSELWKVIPNYQIYSRVYQVEVFEDNGRFTAHLHMTLEFYDKAIEQTVISHTFNQFKPLSHRDMNAFAENISAIFREELDKFTAKIVSYLKKTVQ